MGNAEIQEYNSLVRGAATFILLGAGNPPMTASNVRKLFSYNLEQVNADIRAIVDSERAKVGGVFETIIVPLP